MLNWLTSLFFSLHGRIPRKSYWLAQAILLIPGIIFYFMAYGLEFPVDPGAPPPKPPLLLDLLLLIPAVAVAVKRANDRGHSVWVTTVWLATALVFTTFGFITDPKNFTHGDWVALAAAEVVAIWFVIDFGCLRGDVGPNRFGPDPLGSAVPGSAGQRRTTGENIRDAITGLVALTAIAILLVPQSNGLFAFVLDRMLLPAQLREQNRIWQERIANKPASEEQNDGLAAYRANDYDGALTHFTRAIGLFGPDNAAAGWSYAWRGYTLERLGRMQDARADYEKAGTLVTPDDWLKNALERTRK
jgi:uncharacterized membrane protein YhaH (DUF805 family)